MTKAAFTVFKETDEIFLYLATELERYSREPNKQHISLSGGSTPKGLFNFIVNSKFKDCINWSNLHFWWGDERCVEFSDEKSNYGEAKRLLFDHVAIPDVNVHFIPLDLINTIEDYHLVAEDYATKMKLEICIENDFPIYDWVLLGVGEDGHTASLFPGEFNLDDDQIACCVLKPLTNEFRITISAKTIQSSKRITYLVTGRSKAKIMSEILHENGHFKSYPAFLIQSIKGRTEYLLDKDAAYLLT
jgi:6-phosphogluconolactonase